MEKISKHQIANEGLTPESFLQIHKTPPPKKAAGMTGVFSALKHLFRYVKWRHIPTLTLNINQRKGFDCPGCAWPDPTDERRSPVAEYCENGAKAISEEAQKTTIGRDFFAEHSIASLLEKTDFEIGKSGRLAEPMVIRQGETHYRPISWKDAFSLIGEKLNALSSPDEAAFYTSGRASNEAAFMYQLFVRSYGTNNLPDCSNMCHESSGVALLRTLGIGKGSVTLEDFSKTDLVMIFGQNPGTNHPRMLVALEKCKNNGGKIISVNPIVEAGMLNFINPQKPEKILKGGTNLADMYLQIGINKDIALLKSIIKILHEEEKKNPNTVFDWEFIKQHTADFEPFIEAVEREDLALLIDKTGLDRDTVLAVSDIVMKSKNIIICWAMGLTQHKNAVATIQEVVNLLLIKGSIGKPGAGACPVRGHSNVQGDRTMGIWEKPEEPFLQKLDEVFGMKSPRKEGYDVVSCINKMKEGRLKALVALGGNFLSSSPDTLLTAEGLKGCELTVHVSTKLNRSHLIHGKTGIILPCKGRTEKDIQRGKTQFITVENSMGYISASRGVIDPCSKNIRSEHEIIAGIAKATLSKNNRIKWDDMAGNYAVIRDYIAKVVPGFENFNDRVSLEKGFHLANGARERVFDTDVKKAKFTVNKIEITKADSDEMLMMTIRSHDQFNTTIYGNNDRYRGIANERRLMLIHPEDAEKLGIKENDVVNLKSNYRGVERAANYFKVVCYNIQRGCVATYFPEANSIVPISEFADESLTPIYKSVKVRIEKAA